MVLVGVRVAACAGDACGHQDVQRHALHDIHKHDARYDQQRGDVQISVEALHLLETIGYDMHEGERDQDARRKRPQQVLRARVRETPAEYWLGRPQHDRGNGTQQ